MASLASLVAELNRLILAGQTLEAMERFYADDVKMQENEDFPRVGKPACLEHERLMLERVSNVKATLHRQAINETDGVVFSEWTFESTTRLAQTHRLTQVSVQQWQNEQISSEKFY